MNAKTDKQNVIHTQESYNIRKNISYSHKRQIGMGEETPTKSVYIILNYCIRIFH